MSSLAFLLEDLDLNDCFLVKATAAVSSRVVAPVTSLNLGSEIAFACHLNADKKPMNGIGYIGLSFCDFVCTWSLFGHIETCLVAY